MKKTLFILSTIMVFAILTPSCKKDSASTNTNDLTGTKWVNNVTANNIVVVETITFTSSTAVSDIVTFNGAVNNTYSGSGTYIYTPPSIKFVSANGSTKSGTINGNNLYAPSYDGSATVTYVKQ